MIRATRAIPAIAVAAALLAGCVTERVTNLPGTPVIPLSKQPNAGGASNAAKPAAKPPSMELPNGPIAEPVVGSTFATDVQVEVQSFGRVAYDGQALPVSSPDGGFIAIPDGVPPTWASILAEPEAQAPTSLRISIFRSDRPPLTSVRPAEPLPAGLILGRAADSQGFLVEMPRPDGARWIGKVDWATGRLGWLVQGPDCCAHAVFDVVGNLLFTRRTPGGRVTSLVLRTPAGRESTKEPLGGGYAYPCAVDSAEVVYAFRLSRTGTELETIRVDRTDAQMPRLADTRHSWRISSQPDGLIAHQMASTTPAVWPRTPESLGGLEGGDYDVLTAFDPRKARMVRFNWKTGGIEALTAQSIAACAAPLLPRPGYFCTAAAGLVFIPRPTDGWPPFPGENYPQARVLLEPYVARRLETEPTLYLLIGPAKGQADKIEIVKMAISGN